MTGDASYMKYSILIFFLIYPLFLSAISEEAYLKELNTIFVNYQRETTTPDSWSRLVEKIGDEYYIVRKGDTLWDISQVFFGDGHYWAKLWAVNYNIKNPHLIYPGKKIVFSLSDVDPEVKVSFDGEGAILDGKTSGNANDDDYVVKSKEFSFPGAPPVPKQNIKNSKHLTKFPESITGKSQAMYFDENGISIEIPPYDFDRPLMNIKSFLVSNKLKSFGRPIENIDTRKVISNNQTGFLEIPEGASIGDTFQSLAFEGVLKIKKGVKGYRYRSLGEYKIIAKNLKDNNVYLAVLRNNVGQIDISKHNNLILRKGNIEKFQIYDAKISSPIKTKIIGGDENRSIYSNGSFVFLDQGQKAGINVGDFLYVNIDRNNRELMEVRFSDRKVARLQVVHVSDYVSTAFVISSSLPLMINDIISSTQNTNMNGVLESKSSLDIGEAVEEGFEEIDMNELIEDENNLDELDDLDEINDLDLLEL